MNTSENSAEKKQLNVVDVSAFLEMSLPERELILEPFLPKAGLAMIHAPRGVGKTHLSIGIAIAVATGGSFLKWQATKPRGVLYIDGEMPAIVLQERLKAAMVGGDGSLSAPLRLVTPDLQERGMPDLSTPDGQEAIEQHIADDTELIIVDNLSCLAPSVKENDANDWTRIQGWILKLRAVGKSVLLIHHSGKGGAQRGTSRREDVLDTVIGLKRPEDYKPSEGAKFIVDYEKSRGFYGDDAKSFVAQLENSSEQPRWKTEALEATNYAKVVSMFKHGLSQREITEELGLNKSTVSPYVRIVVASN